MSDGKEPRGFAGIALLASDLEEEAARPQGEEIEAEEGPPASTTEIAQAKAGDATASGGANDEDDSIGFSALSAVASEGPAEERPTTQRGQAIERDDSPTDSPAGKSPDRASPKATAPPAQRPREHAEPTRSEPSRPPQRPSSSRKWIWIWLVLIGAIAFYVFDAAQKGRKPSGDVRSTPQIASKPVPQAPTTRQEGRFSDLTFSVPQAGNENLLNEAELRWCLRAGIQIEALEALPETKVKSTEYYDLLLDFLGLCGINRYDERMLQRVQSEVERHRNEIVANVAATWKQSTARTDDVPASQGKELASKDPNRDSVARSLVFKAIREAEPKYKDYSDDELGRWLSQTYGPDWLKVPADQLVAVSRDRIDDEQKSTVAKAPATASRRGTTEGAPAPASPRPTEPTPDEVSQASPSLSGDRESRQGATSPKSEPLTPASLDRDTARDRTVGTTAFARETPSDRRTSEKPQRPQGDGTVQTKPSTTPLQTDAERSDRPREGGRSASDRASEEVEHTDPDETGRPVEIGDGAAQPETPTVGQASEEARETESAHRGTGPENMGGTEATKTQESDEDPPSSRRQLIHEIQMYLTALGYEPGPIDGLYGRRTQGAIEAFERDMGMTLTGEARIGLWRKVRREAKTGTEHEPREEVTEETEKAGQTSPGG